MQLSFKPTKRMIITERLHSESTSPRPTNTKKSTPDGLSSSLVENWHQDHTSPPVSKPERFSSMGVITRKKGYLMTLLKHSSTICLHRGTKWRLEVQSRRIPHRWEITRFARLLRIWFFLVGRRTCSKITAPSTSLIWGPISGNNLRRNFKPKKIRKSTWPWILM